MSNYSVNIKETMLRKLYENNGVGVTHIAREAGVARSTVYAWMNKMKNKNIVNSKRNNNSQYSAAEKFELVTKYFALDEDSKGSFLREHGFYSSELEMWKNEFINGIAPQKLSKHDKKKIKQLEKEVKRKDKALAEASALLILKKKVDLIWGTDEDEKEQ